MGLGDGFCVGADLKELPLDGELDLSKSLKENFTPMVTGLKALPMPTIAAVNCHCAGAGMGLMLACDFCVAIKSAKFIQAFVNIASSRMREALTSSLASLVVLAPLK